MEFIAAAAVIIVLCIIFRVSVDVMLVGALALVGLVVIAMALFFVVFGVLLVCSKRTEAIFSKVDKRNGGKFNTAFYTVAEKEYPCFFPAEPKFVYKKDKPCKVMLNKRFGLVFDKFSIVTCTVGGVFSLSAAAAAVWLAVNYFL